MEPPATRSRLSQESRTGNVNNQSTSEEEISLIDDSFDDGVGEDDDDGGGDGGGGGGKHDGAAGVVGATSKIYSCDLCDYKSKYRNHVKRHYLRHTEDRPFKCRLCYFEAKERYRFNKHVTAYHPEEAANIITEAENDGKPFK